MIRVVLDTNVLVSALIKPNSVPAFVLEVILEHPDIALCVSVDILGEYQTVLSYGKFEKHLHKDTVTHMLKLLEKQGSMVAPRPVKGLELIDPDDEKFVACAVSARASYLVTGNIKLIFKGYEG